MQKDIIYMAIIVTLFTFLVIANRNGFKLEKENERQSSIIREKSDSIHHFINENGNLINEKEAAIVDKNQLKEYYAEEMKKLKEEFGIEAKNLRALVKNEIKALASGNATIVHNHYDSAGQSYPYWQLKVDDGYLKFKADVYDSLHAPYEYVYEDEITTALSVRKKHWFAKEKLYATTMLSNPNAKVTNATNVLVDTYKDKRWVVYVGAGYSVIGNRADLHIGVGYSLLKF